MARGSEILERAVADFDPVIRALGFEPKRGDRAACVLCGSTNPSSFSFKPEAGKWHCFRCNRGGGVLDLIQEATGCDRRGAMAWLAEFYHVPLDSSPFTAQQRKEWRSRRSQAEARAKKVAAWRDRRLLEMRDRRNELWDQDRLGDQDRRLVCNWARWASQAGSGTEADWEFAWDCIAESLQANDIDAEMQKIEAHSDAKLIRHFIDMDPPPLKSAVATDSPEGARR